MKSQKHKYFDFDDAFPDGRMVADPNEVAVDFDMGAIFKFCKENNRTIESLTDEELKRFTINKKQTA